MRELPPADLIPAEGLREVLKGWSGKGLLSTVKSLPGPDLSEQLWSRSDVQARAERVLLSVLVEAGPNGCGPLCRLPRWTNQWIDAMPATALSHRRVDQSPFRGIDWVTTLRAHGWPPRAFSGRVRHRASDDAILAPAAWVLRRLWLLGRYSAFLPETSRMEVNPRMSAVSDVLQHEAFEALLSEDRPTGQDLGMLAAEGTPWSTVAEIGRLILEIEDDPLAMATRILYPDESIAWRLFHLACLGEVLLALQDRGFNIVSERPLGGEPQGPAYTAWQGLSRFDIWFEAAGAWRHYGIQSPYRQATSNDGRALGADIMLRCSDGSQALTIECKYYLSNPERISRDGYLQALAYASEAKEKLAQSVASIAVGPTRLVNRLGRADTVIGPVFIGPHSCLRSLVAAFSAKEDLSRWQPTSKSALDPP